MKSILMLIVFCLFVPAAQAELKCMHALYFNGVEAVVKDDKLEVRLKGQALESLTIQMKSRDGHIIWADAREKQERPIAGAIMKNSTILITNNHGDLAILQYKGDSYAVTCHEQRL